MEAPGSCRNRGCSKQETWTSNLLNTGDQCVCNGTSLSSTSKVRKKIWPGVVVPIWILLMGQIDMFTNYLYLIGILDTR